MVQGPMSSILVTIRITVRIQESEVRNPDSLNSIMLAFGRGLCSLSTASLICHSHRLLQLAHTHSGSTVGPTFLLVYSQSRVSGNLQSYTHILAAAKK